MKSNIHIYIYIYIYIYVYIKILKLVLNFFSSSTKPSLISSTGPSPNIKKIFLRFLERLKELLLTPKIATFQANLLLKLNYTDTSNAIP